MNNYRAGIDIGSTTVKLVLLDADGNMKFGSYRRHNANTQLTLHELLNQAKNSLGPCNLQVMITGSGALNLCRSLNIGFVQEVVAVAGALKHFAPQTDVAIELGGEDAKIIYFNGGLDERMNGVCAGGTGSFIDQMASLLQTDAAGLDIEAANYSQLYPIAARCGVFAKTDIQPLINDGVSRADLAASIFQAVVNQTISGLACGKPIKGTVAFLGGPLHFLPQLKNAFIRTLKLEKHMIVDPENSHLFAAIGSAMKAGSEALLPITDLIDRLGSGIPVTYESPRLAPLFASEAEYDAFCQRHQKAKVEKEDISEYKGGCYLGIDAGSTTTKLALIGEKGQLLFSYYANNSGDPIKTAMLGMETLASLLPESATILRSCSTGYGESLLKSAFSLDEGEVETIAHCTAAAFFCRNVDCVLDIGGQDMKCIKLKNGTVDSIMLNEACSSGCGSFIENFANSLSYSVEDFAKEAIFAKAPVDLGTRCTVFMNSRVKQAQKEGVGVSDISAGLAYSVIKNALYKVIKLSSAGDLGKNIVVQGGTFHNKAVLRAFENIAGVEAVCPDISGIMGAFGAALIARERYNGQKSTMLSMDEISSLTYSSKGIRCGGCSNNCLLTVNSFDGKRRHISGNRCEKGSGAQNAGIKGENIFEYKLNRIFDYEAFPEKSAPRGVIGIPRVLNIYENYPLWATFFKELGFSVRLSPFSDRKLYELGMDSIPSESECYPAKLSHGHVQWLIENGVDTIFHPCVFYEHQEYESAQNHYNCPIVVSYAENLKNNVEDIEKRKIRYLRPFIALTDEKSMADRLVNFCRVNWGIDEAEVRCAAAKAWSEQLRAKQDIRDYGAAMLERMESNGAHGIVLAGRPYHLDPEINHGIPGLIASYGLYVFTEDCIPTADKAERPLRVLDQWVYHSRLYNAAEYVSSRDDLDLVQLNSFGCGLDAVTCDQVSEILEKHNKLYTVIKIDEVNNLGAVRIRIRSLLAALRMREREHIVHTESSELYRRTEFTGKMRDAGYTIIAPQMSPIHFELIEPVCKKHGYNLVVLDNDNRTAIDTGLKFVNNDACFPSITVVGQIMEAVLSGRYDTDKLAIIMSQTGGCCRASNYVGFIRRALDKVGLSHIPVISLNAVGLERNSGFKISFNMLLDLGRAVIYGDLLMRCLYRVRPYEAVKGSADRLHEKLRDSALSSLCSKNSSTGIKKLCQRIVHEFDVLPVVEGFRKPRVGVVGEILVKYMPLANNHIVELLESEGAEAVVPDLMDFLNYSLYNGIYKHKYLGAPLKTSLLSELGIKAIQFLRAPAIKALKMSRRFSSPMPIEEVGRMAAPFLSLGNQYGEGWFLTGEMVELIKEGVDNIVCIQPFACLPNHVVGKGVIKALKKEYVQANIVAVDYDPGASEVNQLNRIKLMLSSAKDKLVKEK